MLIEELQGIIERIQKETGYDAEMCKEALIDNEFDIQRTIEDLKEFRDEEE